ncbi:MAG: hypothetical protein Q4E35_01330 [Eubacteriales bacterium]|nr:hypothetical protein [Eubacteriales bacterium]
MKKVLAFLMAMTMLVCLAVPSFAEKTTDVEAEGPHEFAFAFEAGNVDADRGATVVIGHDVEIDVNANRGAEVYVGDDVKENVNANRGAEVYVGDDVDGNVEAAGKNTTVVVGEDVEGTVTAEKGASVTVGNDVENKGKADNAVVAEGKDTTVEVKDDVIGGVKATAGATVTVGDNVFGTITENGSIVDVEGNVIGNVNAEDGTVTIGGEVKGTINADGAIVDVEGKVVGDIKAEGEGTEIFIGGDLTGKITSIDGATVIIVGTADGEINTEYTKQVKERIRVHNKHGYGWDWRETSKEADGQVVVGELGKNVEIEGKDNVFYLVGLKEGSALWDELVVTGTQEIGDVHATEASVKDDIRKSVITIAPASDDQIVIVDRRSLPTGTRLFTAPDGTAVITFGRSFNGGLQDLMVFLKDIAKDNPSMIVEIYDGASAATDGIPVAVSVEGEAGAAEVCDVNNHASVRFSADFIKTVTGLTSVKLTDKATGENLLPSAYSVQRHSDGTVTLSFSNSYLQTLETGDHVFEIAFDNGAVFTVTVNVPEA